MKPKQFALLALVAWIAVVGWVGSMVLGKPAALAGRGNDVDTDTAVRLQADVQRTEQVRSALAALVAAPARVASATIVALPPTERIAATGAGTADGNATGVDPNAPAARVLAFIVSGRDLRPRAMIDGTLVGPGARLADGAIVRHIGARSVRIEDSEGQQHTLALRTPGEAGPTPEGSP